MRGDEPLFLTIYDKVIRGVRRVVNVPQPAAGAEWSVTVPGGVQWRINLAVGELQTSAVAGGRIVGLEVAEPGSTPVVYYFQFTMGASAAWVFQWVIGSPAYPTATNVDHPLMGIGPYWIPGGSTVASSTRNADAGDQWSNVRLVVEEAYFTNNELGSYDEYEHVLAQHRQEAEHKWSIPSSTRQPTSTQRRETFAVATKTNTRTTRRGSR